MINSQLTTEEYLIIIGKKLEQLRQNVSYTQNDIANKVDISRKTLSTIENGSNFTIENLIKLLIEYKRMDQLLTLLTLPHNFDFDKYNKEKKEFNKKNKNEWWFK